MTAEATKALKESVGATYDELSRRTGYPSHRISKVLNDAETSAPVLKAVTDACLAIRRENAKRKTSANGVAAEAATETR